jgi:hypothetical protein
VAALLDAEGQFRRIKGYRDEGPVWFIRHRIELVRARLCTKCLPLPLTAAPDTS